MRVKNTEQADKRAHRAYSDYGKEDHFVYGYSGAPLSMSRPAISADPSHISSPRPRRRQSISSAGSTYGYPPPSMRKPRPIIVASAIEKSDFRTHLDGMSASLRGKLGRLMKGGDDHTPLGRRRTGPVTVSSDTESRSTDFTPSINAVPSLTASTSPSEGPPTYPSFGPSTSHVIRAKQQQQQESVLHKIRRFEGGGKLPQLGWKSLASVSDVPLSTSSGVCADQCNTEPRAMGREWRYVCVHVYARFPNEASTIVSDQFQRHSTIRLKSIY